MKLGAKILIAAAAVVIVATTGSIVVTYAILRDRQIAATEQVAETMILQAETVRENFDSLHTHKAFDLTKLREELGKVAIEETDLYRTIPVVAAWRSIAAVASASDFTFITPTAPDIPARNARNAFKEEFRPMFTSFSSGTETYRTVADGIITVARPVRLTTSCLQCHGDPANSLTGDGKDPLGVRMEDMKVGDLKGAFILTKPIDYSQANAAAIRVSLMGLLILMGSIAAFAYINRRLIVLPLSGFIERLARTSSETSCGSAEIARASQNLADSATKQAASLEETSASVQELASMVRTTAGNTQAAQALASQAKAAAERGAAAMAELGKAINGIKSNADRTAKIVKTIDEIAFQTNLLALNAAVEAARAGDAGKGFAVVAEEVRNLAGRAGEAARTSAELINASVTSADNAVGLGKDADAVIAQLAESSRKVADLAADIAASTKEQDSGLGQITGSMQAMDKGTQTTAAGAEESNATSLALQEQVAELNRLVEELAGMVGATRATGPGASAPHRATTTTTTA